MMRIYTVHEPPPKRRSRSAQAQASTAAGGRGPDAFVFVRDGFHFWAFLLTPFWLFFRRLWLVLLGYLVLAVGMAVGLRWAGVSAAGMFWAQVLLSLLVALEAGSLARWTLRRRKWREVGVVAADSREAAERRFFDAWAAGEVEARAPQKAAAAVPAVTRPVSPPPSPTSSGIVGLFPEPGASR